MMTTMFRYVYDLRESDGYTSTPNRVRIFKEDYGDEWPWTLDGIEIEENRRVRGYTEECLRFATFEEAVAAIPRLIADFNESLHSVGYKL